MRLWVQFPETVSSGAGAEISSQEWAPTYTYAQAALLLAKADGVIAGTPVTSFLMQRRTEARWLPNWPVEGVARFQQRTTSSPSLLSGSKVPPNNSWLPKALLWVQT